PIALHRDVRGGGWLRRDSNDGPSYALTPGLPRANGAVHWPENDCLPAGSSSVEYHRRSPGDRPGVRNIFQVCLRLVPDCPHSARFPTDRTLRCGARSHVCCRQHPDGSELTLSMMATSGCSRRRGTRLGLCTTRTGTTLRDGLARGECQCGIG